MWGHSYISYCKQKVLLFLPSVIVFPFYVTLCDITLYYVIVSPTAPRPSSYYPVLSSGKDCRRGCPSVSCGLSAFSKRESLRSRENLELCALALRVLSPFGPRFPIFGYILQKLYSGGLANSWFHWRRTFVLLFSLMVTVRFREGNRGKNMLFLTRSITVLFCFVG